MDYSICRTEFDANGFTTIRGFLPPDELLLLRSELDRYIRDVVPGLPDGEAFYEDRSRPDSLKQLHRIERDEFFADYLNHPRWRSAAEAMLGEPAASPKGAEWFNKPPGTKHITPPHQDNYYFCLSPPRVLTMWLALDEVDEENGCLRYVRGSHRGPIRQHRRTTTLGFSQGVADYSEFDRELEVPIPALPGDVLIHHGNTIHRADFNRSATRHRRSFGMVFQAACCVRDEDAFQRYLQSSKGQQQSLGLKTAGF